MRNNEKGYQMNPEKAMRLAKFYGEKMTVATLTEYEVLMYEACCNYLTSIFKTEQKELDPNDLSEAA